MSKLAINKGTPVRTKPWPSWPIYGEREIELLTEVVNSGQWGFGPKEREFASKFAEYQGAKHGICVSGGARALEVALRAAGIGFGDEVIIPALTFVGTAEGVWSVNAIPILADVDPDTYCIDAAKVEEAITPYTKAIMPVYLAGCMPEWDAIMGIADRHNLIVVEDAARAHGSRWNGKGAGTIGHLGGFSLQSSKGVNCGEGGIILTNDDTLAELCWAYRNNGRLGPDFKTKEHVFGRNYRISEFQAAVALAQLERVDEQVNRREENALYLSEKLAEIDGIRPMKRDERVTRQNYYTYVFRYEADVFGVPRGRFVEAMNAEGIPIHAGIDSPLQFDSLFVTDPDKFPLSHHKRKIDYSKVRTPVAERACEEGVSFGQSLLLGIKEDMDDIVEAILKIKENVD
ncbi:TPA: DegT/DnrJ/EryC1/StrS family aminotransferase, partial [Candidatus Poribacteria bacterium]|nr:DegT/DnrJ/EryC1/StrS family aminotransferase [Candidatus Poribacteria bacterium]